ncbi:hypothetical protein OOU_Y34scaffold00308g56 [Pyricularia oryzae Y34]|uniref:Uncharacterized protein n=3 Tax=Pyricularia oryzae TaxID=318829 RepID=Q2KF42_PYRO7|nr:hypothetical protein MGCH7_ch7g844 [Pyricularia oryzae 70-15]ELQ41045.1 hypothetical protein OOU_Y34scaffold00308g56 [Pyricularia oryzae Y34]
MDAIRCPTGNEPATRTWHPGFYPCPRRGCGVMFAGRPFGNLS